MTTPDDSDAMARVNENREVVTPDHQLRVRVGNWIDDKTWNRALVIDAASSVRRALLGEGTAPDEEKNR